MAGAPQVLCPAESMAIGATEVEAKPEFHGGGIEVREMREDHWLGASAAYARVGHERRGILVI